MKNMLSVFYKDIRVLSYAKEKFFIVMAFIEKYFIGCGIDYEGEFLIKVEKELREFVKQTNKEDLSFTNFVSFTKDENICQAFSSLVKGGEFEIFDGSEVTQLDDDNALLIDLLHFYQKELYF